MMWTKNPGRVAGILYQLLLVAPLRLIYIPNTMFVRGDPSATANNILAHETLFRLGMFSELFMGVVLIFLTFAFFQLFKCVNRFHVALVIVLGGIMPACINFVNVVNDAAALLLIRGGDYLAVFDKPQRDALAMLFLRLHGQQIVAGQMLWGLWLMPLAALFYRSRFAPRFIALWVFINGCAYLVMSIAGLLLPQYENVLGNIAFPAMFGELALMSWLAIKGVDQRTVDAFQPRSTASIA